MLAALDSNRCCALLAVSISGHCVYFSAEQDAGEQQGHHKKTKAKSIPFCESNSPKGNYPVSLRIDAGAVNKPVRN